MILSAEGRLHADKIDAIADPPSLVDQRRRLEGMLPRVDLRDLIEVMAWHPGFVAAFAGVSGGRSRLADLHVDDRRRADGARAECRLRPGDLRKACRR
jgi:hypothetical protein